MAVINAGLCQEVKTNGELCIRWGKVGCVLCSVRRKVSEEILGQIPVRINETYSMAGLRQLKNQVPQKSCFPRTRFSNHIAVMP